MFSRWLVWADNMGERQSPAVKRHTLLQNNNRVSSKVKKKNIPNMQNCSDVTIWDFWGAGVLVTFSGHFHFYGHCHGHHHHSLQMILDSVLFPASFSCHTWNRLTMWANFNFPENPAEAHRCHFCPPVCQSRHGQVNKYVPFIILGIIKL